MVDDLRTDLDVRLPLLRVRDVILAALQAAFAKEDLFGEGTENKYLYVREDPKASRIWISSEEGRTLQGERDGRRNTITVGRGDYVPSEGHLHNYAGGSFHNGEKDFTDLAACPIFINCDAGNEIESETLASICYHVLKLFRQQIMRDFDLHDLRLLVIGTATLMSDVPGEPWRTMVQLKVEHQEFAHMTVIADRLNHLDITSHLAGQPGEVVSLDATEA